jgi:hypothetical protein
LCVEIFDFRELLMMSAFHITLYGVLRFIGFEMKQKTRST